MKGAHTIITTGRTPGGVWREVIVKTGENWYPGMFVQPDPSVAEVEGCPTFKLGNVDADGARPKGAPWIVTDVLQFEQGRIIEASLATALASNSNRIPAGEHAMVYSPLAGEELNLLYHNETGTADDLAAGDMLIIDDANAGYFTITAGSPETEMAMVREAVVDPILDTTVWCQWTGY